MSLTAEQNELLWALGEAFLVYIAELATYVFWYGMFVLLFSISVSFTLRRKNQGLPAKIMFGASVIGFVVGTLNVGTQLSGFIIFVRDALVNNVDVPLEARPPIVDQELVATNIISAWASFIPPVIGDATVIWRAWAIFPENPWVIAFPGVLWFGTLGTTLAYLGLLTTPSGFASFVAEGSVDRIIQASLAMSFVTNITATGLIGWKLWSHRRFLTKDLGLTKHRSPAQKILIVLIESGILYFAIQLTYFMLTIYKPGDRGSVSRFIAYTFSSTYSSISAMYPTIVIVLVNFQRSINDVVGFSTVSPGVPNLKADSAQGGQRDATFGHLSFAAAPGVSGSDLESSHSSSPEIRSEKPGAAVE